MLFQLQAALFAGFLTVITTSAAWGSDKNEKAPLTDRQLSVMMFVDYGRSYGYQSMMALIKVDTVKAELERDRKLLEQKEELFRKNAIPPIELEVARLKHVWNQKQLIVAEKSLATVAAQYEAMKKMTQHFGGVEIPVGELYAIFRRAWDAGCEKGPDEVVAMKAWADYARKSLERAQQLSRDGNASFASVLEKEAQFKTAQSNYRQRQSRLDRCRQVLFPSLDEILAIER